MEIIKSRKKEKFIENASKEALKSPMLFRHGCVAVYGGKQIASGYNYHRTYSKDKSILKDYTCSMHAEIDCIRKIKNSRFKNKLKNIYSQLWRFTFCNVFKQTLKSKLYF